MCNLFSNTTTQEAMRRIVDGLTDRAGNLAPGRLYPDQLAPIIRHDGDGLELATPQRDTQPSSVTVTVQSVCQLTYKC